MEAIWENISNFLAGASAQMIYWGLAIIGTFFFAMTCLMNLFGFGGVDSPDFDADGSLLDHADTGYMDFRLFSLRSILAFLTVFGWGGVVWGYKGISGFLISFFCGFVTMVITAFFIWLALKLQSSGNLRQEDFSGKPGTVYLGIPGGTAAGKVVVSVGGATQEIAAVADEPLPTGTPVVVVKPLDGKRFFVKKS